MSLPVVDVLVIVFLALGTFTGLRTLHLHRGYWLQYRVSHLVFGRMDARLYVLTAMSTALCFADLGLRTYWMFSVGWDDVGRSWGSAWLVLHFVYAALATYLHQTTHVLLQSRPFCALCMRQWNAHKQG